MTESLLAPPCHQPGPGRTADRGRDISILESNPGRSQGINVGRLQILGTLHTEIRPAQVICENNNDVWTGRGSQGRRCLEQTDPEDEQRKDKSGSSCKTLDPRGNHLERT